MAERCYKSGAFKRRKINESEKALSQSLKSNLRLENFLVTTCTEENVPPILCAPDHDINSSLSITQQEYSSQSSGEFEIEHDDTIANFSSANEETTFSDDPFTWSHVTEAMQSYWAKEGRDVCQHIDDDFMASVHKYANEDFYRHCTKNVFYRRHLKSGELVLRKWLIYSPSCGNLFCFTCKMFDLDTNHCSFVKEGFRDWKHADRALTMHENSEMHRQSLLK